MSNVQLLRVFALDSGKAWIKQTYIYVITMTLQRQKKRKCNVQILKQHHSALILKQKQNFTVVMNFFYRKLKTRETSRFISRYFSTDMRMKKSFRWKWYPDPIIHSPADVQIFVPYPPCSDEFIFITVCTKLFTYVHLTMIFCYIIVIIPRTTQEFAQN